MIIKVIKQIFSDYCKDMGITQIKDDTHSSLLNIPQISKKIINNSNSETQLTKHIEFSYNLDQPSENSYAYQNNTGMIKILLKSTSFAKYDLHGMRKGEALTLLEIILTKPDTTLLIVHGQGLNSQHNNSVLKHLTRSFLRNHTRVLCYTTANTNNGGDGATLVKLRKL